MIYPYELATFSIVLGLMNMPQHMETLASCAYSIFLFLLFVGSILLRMRLNI